MKERRKKPIVLLYGELEFHQSTSTFNLGSDSHFNIQLGNADFLHSPFWIPHDVMWASGNGPQ